jgi:hypothetical protein
MTRTAYLRHLTAMHRIANRSDTVDRLPWQKFSDCATHCTALESIARDMLTPAEFQAWLDNL